MRTTRNQVYIALLQKSKQNEEYLIYKNMSYIFIMLKKEKKKKRNQQTSIIYKII